ncbi:MAG: hypothetical protein V4649_02550 [Bacteroidota bacterium]
MMRILLLLLILAIAASYNCFAQVTNRPWKKRVTRLIDVTVANNSINGRQGASMTDTSLVHVIVNAVQSGYLKAYSASDDLFSTFLERSEIDDGLVDHVDTLLSYDWPTGKEVVELRLYPSTYKNAHEFKVLEDWSFNPTSGASNIQIIGLAPVHEVYGDDSSFRGYKTLFWVKYSDALSTLSNYEQSHPKSGLASHIWTDYFQQDKKSDPKK